MTYKMMRMTIGLTAGFIALTAIGGGLAMLAGLEDFPLAWLEGTPFNDFTIPAILLSVVVGGSALVVAIALFTGRRWMRWAAVFAGAMMSGYIVIEAIILNQDPPGPTAIEIGYFVLGILLFGSALLINRLQAAPEA